MMVAAAAVMSPSHRATRVIAAPAVALRPLSRQVRDNTRIPLILDYLEYLITLNNCPPKIPEYLGYSFKRISVLCEVVELLEYQIRKILDSLKYQFILNTSLSETPKSTELHITSNIRLPKDCITENTRLPESREYLVY